MRTSRAGGSPAEGRQRAEPSETAQASRDIPATHPDAPAIEPSSRTETKKDASQRAAAPLQIEAAANKPTRKATRKATSEQDESERRAEPSGSDEDAGRPRRRGHSRRERSGWKRAKISPAAHQARAASGPAPRGRRTEKDDEPRRTDDSGRTARHQKPPEAAGGHEQARPSKRPRQAAAPRHEDERAPRRPRGEEARQEKRPAAQKAAGPKRRREETKS